VILTEKIEAATARKLAPVPAPSTEGVPNDVLLQALVILTEKIEAMERRTSAVESRNERPTAPRKSRRGTSSMRWPGGTRLACTPPGMRLVAR